MPEVPFHLAIPVHDLAAARAFYGQLLGCAEGRSAATWVDFDFHGHQLVCHLDSELEPTARNVLRNQVDGEAVPVPHFGLVLPMAEWRTMADRLVAAGTDFVVEPCVRFAGQPAEQATLFVLDPSGNALELKAFADQKQLFATEPLPA